MAATMALPSSVPLATGAVGLGTLFGLQTLVAYQRARSDMFEGVVDNAPLLRLAGPEILHDHLRLGNVSIEDLRGQLREAGVRGADRLSDELIGDP